MEQLTIILARNMRILYWMSLRISTVQLWHYQTKLVSEPPTKGQHLNSQASKTSLFPNLHNNLISIGQLCNDGYTVTLIKSTMTVIKNLQLFSVVTEASQEMACGIYKPSKSFPTSTISQTTHTQSPSNTLSQCNYSKINHDQGFGNLPTYCVFLTSQAHIPQSH